MCLCCVTELVILLHLLMGQGKSLHTTRIPDLGGDSLVDGGYRDVPLFRGDFFLKRAALSVSFIRIGAEVWVAFEATCRILGTILGQCDKNCQEEERICKGW